MTQSRRKRWLLGSAVGLVVVALAAGVGLYLLDRYISTALRTRAIAVLEERLKSDVELGDLRVSLRSAIAVEGRGLVIRYKARQDVPPLVSIASFSAQVPWSGFWAAPRRIASVDIRGLQIVTPPDQDDSDVRETESGGCQDRSAVRGTLPSLEPAPFVIQRLTSQDATLTLLPSRPDKRPRVFQIAAVELTDFALDRAAAFVATLTNPVPHGAIETEGRFGPWNAGAPGATPVEGAYRFSNADLGTIKGIAGQLESTGRFEGLLQHILVKGEARVAGFGLTTSRNRLPLETRFETCVDGTDGDTYLDRVDALLQDTPIAAAGRVEGKVGLDGRIIALDVHVDDGRIQDLLRLAVDDPEPLMTGSIDVDAAFILPPGEGEVVERLDLKGRFGLRDTRFSEGSVQGKIDELSRRGRGDVKSDAAKPVRSALDGRFSLQDGRLQLSRFSFAVPGAVVQLEGRYGLRSEEIDFRGRLRTEARVSQMTTGFKSALLKAVDPLFARDGAGAVIPITIGGTRKSPSMNVDIKKALFRRD
jgi:hypothetical protein